MIELVNSFGGVNGGANVTGTSTVYGGTPNNNSSAFPQVGGTGTSFKGFTQPTNALNFFILPVPSEYILEGQQFAVRASGWVLVKGTTPTIQVELGSIGTSTLASASVTALATLPATAATLTTSAFYPFALEARLQGDSNSGIVQGVANLLLNNVFTSTAAITSLSGIAFGTANSASNPAATQGSVFNLVCGVVFGVSNAANLAQLSQFSLEA